LYEGASGNAAILQDVIAYHTRIGEPNFPIFADGSGKLRASTPMTQNAHPEMCAVTPEFEIISCYAGHGGYESALDDIKAHAGL
jgi:hypothetical protein